jgi:hypothetical protein
MSNPLEGLKPTTWYKALALVAAPAFLIALAAGRDSIMVLSAGAFLIAVGEWRYYTGKEISFRQTPAGMAKVTDVPRKLHIDGVLIQCTGVAVIIYGIYRIYSLGAL